MFTPQEIVEGWLEEAKATAPPDSYAARRTEPRYEWHCQLEMKADGKVHYVRTLDISQCGIGINARLPLNDGEPVLIRRDDSEPWVPARIKRATQTIGGYKVGVGFDLELAL